MPFLNFKNVAKPLQIINKTETTAEILLYGSIGESFWEDSISAKQFTEELKKLPESIKEIHLRVNSPGGSVFDGMAIYERLKTHKAKVIAYVDGLAASIASIIIMAADEVVVGDGAMVMLHKPLVMTYGNADEHDRMISILDKVEEQMITIYQKKTGMSRAEIAKVLTEETWYTADEAIEVNLADKKIEAVDTLHMAASMIKNSPWLKKKPEMVTKDAEIKSKLKDFLNKEKKK